MSLSTPRSVKPRPRTILAISATLALGGAATLAVPGATLAAQGDNDVVIGVIERSLPSVVTIQADFSQAVQADEEDQQQDQDDDQDQPEDDQDDDQDQPEDEEGQAPDLGRSPAGGHGAA